MSFKLSLIIIFLFSFTKVYTDNVSLHHDYSLSRLFSRGAKDLCTNITCKDKPHTMCIEASYVAPNCKYFQKIEFTHEKIRNILNGHNGLRNRIAVDRYKPASNMLYLVSISCDSSEYPLSIPNYLFKHWDKELEQMAGKHLQRCLIQNDTCDFIGEFGLKCVISEYWTFSRPAQARKTWRLDRTSNLKREIYRGTLNCRSFGPGSWREIILIMSAAISWSRECNEEFKLLLRIIVQPDPFSFQSQ